MLWASTVGGSELWREGRICQVKIKPSEEGIYVSRENSGSAEVPLL